MLSSIRLRRALLIVVLAVGVLSMHGLATADAANSHTPLTAVVDGLAGESRHGGDTGHDPMHAVGELCLWLIVAGAIITVAACSPSKPLHLHFEPPIPGERRATPPSPAGRSPDVHLIGVALRC